MFYFRLKELYSYSVHQMILNCILQLQTEKDVELLKFEGKKTNIKKKIKQKQFIQCFSRI